MESFCSFFCIEGKNAYICIRESHTRPAPSEFPQGLTAARVGGRSGAMYSAFPFFYAKFLRPESDIIDKSGWYNRYILLISCNLQKSDEKFFI